MNREATIYGDGWVFVNPDFVLDHLHGLLWRVRLDLEVCRFLMAALQAVELIFADADGEYDLKLTLLVLLYVVCFRP